MRAADVALAFVFLTLGAALGGCGEDEPARPSRRSAATEAPTFVPIAGGVGWMAQAPLVYRRPSNEMRSAEYVVEGHEGTVLAVSYFPPEQGGGGDVRENVDRWVGQFQRERGTQPAIEERTINDLPITTVDVRGTFVGRRGTGGSNPPRVGWRLLGAIVRAEDGLVFFKLTGPQAGVDAAQAAFEELVASIHPE